MKRFLKYLFVLCLLLFAGGSISYATIRYRLPEQYVLIIDQDTLVVTRPVAGADSLSAEVSLPASDSLASSDSIPVADSLAASDSIVGTDSLSLFERTLYSYDYYGNVIDSFTAVKDSAGMLAGYQRIGDTVVIPRILDQFWTSIDTVTFPYLDSMYAALYQAMTVGLPDAKDIKRAERKNRKDYRDSVKQATPRIMETFAIPDSLYYEHILTWSPDMKFNEIELKPMDTTYNYYFNEIPFMRNDVNGTYLGTVGSAAQSFNWFKRDGIEVFPALDPYTLYGFTPETVPQYNTKTPYTELAYWGTPFVTKKMEESQVKLLSTQNISPELNLTLGYRQQGSKGMLLHEETNNRSSFVGLNYLGKRYLMNAGYIGQTVIRNENGGIVDPFWVKDTIVDSKTVTVHLDNASNLLKKTTFYLTHSLAVPMNFFRKNKDSLALGEGTMAFIGHSMEYSKYNKHYTDNISSSNAAASAFYNNEFNVSNSQSSDIMDVKRFENKLFIKLQPFATDAIISKINGGIGYQILSIYDFTPEYYYKGIQREVQHNMYVYAGAEGQFRKYFAWDADGKYNYAGYYLNDFELNGKVRFSLYPFRDGIHLTGKFHTSLKEPAYYQQHLYFNHHKWDNDFDKTSKTQFEVTLEIPVTNTKATVDYALVNNLVYYDTLSYVRQFNETLSILSASLEQNIRLGILHLDNKALFQLTSNEEVLPLPELALNLRYYVQFPVVKDVMTMQIGLNGLVNSEFYIQDYSPDLGVFFNQNKELVGGWKTPYFDAFVNMQWHNVSVYVKYTNCFINKLTTDYFSAYHYIRPQTGFKLGVFWPFTIR